MDEYNPVIAWLLDGDPAIVFQARRDLLNDAPPELRAEIAIRGWGKAYLDAYNGSGWGSSFYDPKWTSTHYTLLDLASLELPRDHPIPTEALHIVLSSAKGDDGGINPARSISQSDACINGMFLNYACYFAAPERDLRSVVDFLIAQQMPDGGYNCRKNRSGARHSSLHSTISVLEGVTSYVRHNYTYRAEELGRIAAEAEHFALEHRLYKSDHTGKIIHPGFLRFPYPTRWYYNILRGLDYFRAAGRPLDPRMHDALTEVVTKQRPDGRFSVNAAPPGAVHMVMEPAGKPSRWITLVALRVLNAFGAGRTAARV